MRFARIVGGSDYGALPAVVFDPKHFVQMLSGRPVFRPAKDTALLHLGHPLFRHALGLFARARFPGGHQGVSASRWTVRVGQHPPRVRRVACFSPSRSSPSTNCANRSTIGSGLSVCRYVRVRSVEPLEPVPPGDDSPSESVVEEARSAASGEPLARGGSRAARRYWSAWRAGVTSRVEQQLRAAAKAALATEKERFRHRLKEVERAMQETTLQKLERERDRASRRDAPGSAVPGVDAGQGAGAARPRRGTSPPSPSLSGAPRSSSSRNRHGC